MQPPRLTDRPQLERQRRRAARAPADFLHHEAVVEVQERLGLVNRPLTDVAVVTGYPSGWGPAFPGARVVPDAEVLALEPEGFDLLVHAMALHWADDPVGQIVQCARALRPDGLFLAVFFGGRTLHELRAALAEAEVAVSGGLSPRVAPMGEIRDLGALLQRAGLALPVADSVTLPVSYESPLHLMRDLRAMGEGNALAGRLRRFTRRALFAEAAARYPAGPDGRVTATFEMIVLTGWKPHPDQQKPLRPGSAAARLADALGTVEHGTGDPV